MAVDRKQIIFAISVGVIFFVISECASLYQKKAIPPAKKGDLCLFYNHQICDMNDIVCILNERNFFCICARNNSPELAREICLE